MQTKGFLLGKAYGKGYTKGYLVHPGRFNSMVKSLGQTSSTNLLMISMGNTLQAIQNGSKLPHLFGDQEVSNVRILLSDTQQDDENC